MAKIDDSTINRVLEHTDIVDVVSQFVGLKKKGQRWIGLCPFHDDTHATNFVVYPKKQCYKCFACDAKGDAVKFLMDSQHMSFADAIRWLGKRAGIDVDGQSVDVTPIKRTPPPPLPTLFVQESMVRVHDQFCTNFHKWLRQIPWETVGQQQRVEQMMAEYHVGASKWGHVIWWQIDQNGGVRTGKMMRYKDDGHRDHAPGSNDWVHSALQRAGMFDPSKAEMRQTLFGMHLLNKYPNADVHIYESEKTALIAAIYFGNDARSVYMACGGKYNLNREKLAPIIAAKRIIALHPDHDAIGEWTALCKQLDYDRAYINNTVQTLMWREADGPKADDADVLLRVMDDSRRDRITKKLADIMPDVMPAARLLVDHFDLEEEHGTTGRS